MCFLDWWLILTKYKVNFFWGGALIYEDVNKDGHARPLLPSGRYKTKVIFKGQNFSSQLVLFVQLSIVFQPMFVPAAGRRWFLMNWCKDQSLIITFSCQESVFHKLAGGAVLHTLFMLRLQNDFLNHKLNLLHYEVAGQPPRKSLLLPLNSPAHNTPEKLLLFF